MFFRVPMSSTRGETRGPYCRAFLPLVGLCTSSADISECKERCESRAKRCLNARLRRSENGGRSSTRLQCRAVRVVDIPKRPHRFAAALFANQLLCQCHQFVPWTLLPCQIGIGEPAMQSIVAVWCTLVGVTDPLAIKMATALVAGSSLLALVYWVLTIVMGTLPRRQPPHVGSPPVA